MKKGLKNVSVIMPTYNQSAFIRRAITSLQQQTHSNWELIVVDDGCTDDTHNIISDFLADHRIRYIRNDSNLGLGHAINRGLDSARYDLIAYLPSDDYYYPKHLETLITAFDNHPEFFLVYSGVRYETNDSLFHTADTQSLSTRQGYCLQLVQVAHRKTSKRWLTRNEFVTEDLYQMFWEHIASEGVFGMTGEITCHWTSHPHQRCRLISERYGGGLNKYRQYYNVKSPIRLRVTKDKFIDEEKLYDEFRAPQSPCSHPLKILIVGELAYNPERIYALEEAGHKLYGLWDTSPRFSFSTVGPIPFGHIEDVPFDNWQQRIKEIKPDIIYAMLNFGSIPFAWSVLRQCPEIPFVWHFKEGPHLAMRQGNFEKLIWLYRHASGRIFLNEQVKEWFMQFLPPSAVPAMCMDGDLPKQNVFKDCFMPKLSDTDGEIHTVVTGRMIGINGSQLAWLAEHGIHVHLYTENYFDDRERENMGRYKIAPRHFHVHPHVAADRWTEELSRYDAGWLHCATSQNNGNILHACWDDFNIPARISTYAAAGLPLIVPDNTGHIVATNAIAKATGTGIFYDNYETLERLLRKEIADRLHTSNMKRNRLLFSFDHYVPQLIQLFRDAIHHKANEQ